MIYEFLSTHLLYFAVLGALVVVAGCVRIVKLYGKEDSTLPGVGIAISGLVIAVLPAALISVLPVFLGGI